MTRSTLVTVMVTAAITVLAVLLVAWILSIP
jgi:hypothetical protein